MCEKYLSSIQQSIENSSELSSEFSKEKSIVEEMLNEEKLRFKEIKNSMFSLNQNTTIQVLDKEIKQRKRVYEVRGHFLFFQRFFGGFVFELW